MNMRLMVRMTAPTVAISLLLLALGVVAAWHVHTLQRRISNTLQVNVSSMRAAEELEISVRELRTAVQNYLLTQDRKYIDRIHLLRPEIERWRTEAIRCATTAKEQELMLRVNRGLNRFYSEWNAGESPEELIGRLGRLGDDILTQEVLESTHEYLDYNEKEVEKTSQENRVQAGRLIFGLLLLGTCGSAAGLVAGLGLARAVNRSLVQLSVPLRAAAGQLDEVVGPITFAASWDLNELEGVLRTVAERISAVIEKLRQSEREVLRAEQLAAVGQMAAGMAHEVRNPLTAMKILVQSALASEDGAGILGERDLAVLEEEITRLERVIEAFLHFARPPELELRPVELGPLVEKCANLVAARAALCDVAIETSIPSCPVQVVVDPGQVHQVLLNLLLNALDATGQNGRIRVVLNTIEEGVQLQVCDTGCGLPLDLGARIFSPFVSTKQTGLGLGLSICKRIVETHGGRIDARNGPEGGAVFAVWLPLPEQTLPESLARTALDCPPGETHAHLAGHR